MSEEKFDLWPGLIPLPAMLPSGQLTTVWWPAEVPLPDTFVLKETPDNPGVFDFVTDKGVLRP
jgi:hypothetical protein